MDTASPCSSRCEKPAPPPAHGRRCARGSTGRGRRLGLVAGDDGGLGGAGGGTASTRSPVAGQNAAPGAFQPPEQLFVAQQAIFSHLGVAGPQFPCRQSIERRRIATTRTGWWKAPTRFFPWGELMPVLPPTEESTCDSKVVGACTTSTPTPHHGRRKPGEIADPRRRPAPEPDRAVPRGRRSALPSPAEGRRRTCCPRRARRRPWKIRCRLPQRRLHRAEMLIGHILVGHHRNAGARPQVGDAGADLPQQAGPMAMS